jgi:hypothetical protein
MHRTILIDYNTERNPDLIVSPIQIYENEDIKACPVLDMNILCEAVGSMIKLCHTEGIKKDSESIRDCVDRLKKIFIDTSFKTVMTTIAKNSMADSTAVPQ